MITITLPDGSTLAVDASLRQEHDISNAITEYPTETGATITDNIRARPRRFTLEGVISVTPILAPGSAPPNPNAHIAAYNRLKAAATAQATIGVKTGLETYKNLAIEGLVVPRSPETGVDLYFTLTLIEITYASTATTTVPADALGDTNTIRQAQAVKHRGLVATTPATTAQTAAASKAIANAAHKPQQRYLALLKQYGA